MARNLLHFTLDLLLLLALLSLLSTGLLMAFILPPGQGNMGVWGLGRHDWGNLHYYLALSALALAACHLALHWSWVCAVAAQILGRHTAAVALWKRLLAATLLTLLLAALLASFLTAASYAKHPTPGSGPGRGAGQHQFRGGR